MIVVSKARRWLRSPAAISTPGRSANSLPPCSVRTRRRLIITPSIGWIRARSGLLCVARHAHAQRLLTRQLHTDSFIREYLAVTEGIPAQPEGVIDAPIARLGAGAKRAVCPDGQRAVTHYRVEQIAGGRALIRLRLETGRTHQIRVHLSHIGCPICGDYLYGRELPELKDRSRCIPRACAASSPSRATVKIVEPMPEAMEKLLCV